MLQQSVSSVYGRGFGISCIVERSSSCVSNMDYNVQ